MNAERLILGLLRVLYKKSSIGLIGELIEENSNIFNIYINLIGILLIL